MALCSPSVLPNEPLVTLLQDSISCIQDDAFHPVLYQALSGLHEYLGSHQRRLQGTPCSSSSWQRPRPSFCQSQDDGDVVAFGWMEEATSSCSNNDDGVAWTPVILLLLAAAAGEPCLRIVQETPTKLETKKQIPLRSLLVEPESIYGDPRLVLSTQGGDMVTLRCATAAAWAAEIQAVLRNDNFQPEYHPTVNPSVEVSRDDENDADIVHDPSEHPQVELEEEEESFYFRDGEHSGEAPFSEIEMGFDDEELSEQCEVLDRGEWLPIEAFLDARNHQNGSSVKKSSSEEPENSTPTIDKKSEQAPPTKQIAEEKLQELEPIHSTPTPTTVPNEQEQLSAKKDPNSESADDQPRKESQDPPLVPPGEEARPIQSDAEEEPPQPPQSQDQEQPKQPHQKIQRRVSITVKLVDDLHPPPDSEDSFLARVRARKAKTGRGVDDDVHPDSKTEQQAQHAEKTKPPPQPQQSQAPGKPAPQPQPQSQQQQRQQQLQSQMQERLQQPQGQEHQQELQQQMQERLQKQQERPNQRDNEQFPQVPKSIQQQKVSQQSNRLSAATQKSNVPQAQPIQQRGQTAPPQVPPQHPQAQQQQRQQQLQTQMHTRMQQPQGQQHQQMQDRLQQQTQGGAVSAQRAATPPTPSAPTTQFGKEMRVEQQKKLAQERRKQDLESQRKLAREEQKRKDLEAKRKFLQKEQRKQELVAKNQTRTSSNDASANLRQINQQLAEIDAEIIQVQSRAGAIKAEIEQRKNQPLQMPTGQQQPQQNKGAAAAAQRRREEQARREQNLAAQKKAEFQKRQKELEEQRRKAREEQKRKEEMQKRRFLEHEKRKQDLMAKAKAGKAQAKDSGLLQKVNNQISGLDTEAKQRAEEAKAKEEAKETAEDQNNEEVDDPEAARKRIAEEARQRELEEDMKRTSSATEKAKSPRVNLAKSASSEEGVVGHGWGQQANAPKINLATSASSEEGGVGGSWGQQPQQATFTPSGQQPHQAAYTPSSPSHTDPFGHLQVPGQHAQYHQPAMHRSSPTHGVPPYPYPQQFSQAAGSPYGHNTASVSPPQYYYPTGVQQQQQPQQHRHQAPHGRHQPGYQNHIPPYHQNHSPPYQQSHAQTPPVHSGFPHPSSSHRRPPQPSPSAPQSAPQPTPPSGTNHNQKYAVTQNSEDDDDDDQSALTDLKKKIIVGWALTPENTGLRPIYELLCSIQTVYPPANNLPPHTYFEGWKAVSDGDVRDGQALDEKKLSKAVRKLRFFLHPDKLPRDLTDEQHFVCKLLWDITNDAFADYKKALEDLDWMNN